jgi:hypothetical protein
MKMYIAGPMSGIPQFNYPAFIKAAQHLRDLGHEVVSPAEMDSEEMKELAMASETGNWTDLGGSGESWGDVLAKDVKLVADEIEGVTMLPGWEKSRGARLEAFVAMSVHKPVFRMHPESGIPVEIPKLALAGTILENTVNQGDVSRYKEINYG